MRRIIGAFLNLPIKLKLIGTNVFLLLLIAVFIFVYYPTQQKRQLERELNNKLMDMTEMVALGVGVALYTGDSKIIVRVSDWAKSDEDLACIIVLDQEKEEIVGYNSERLSVPPVTLLAETSITTLEGVSYFTFPIEQEGTMYGYAIVGLSRSRLESEINQNRMTSVVVCLAILILGTGVVWVLSNLLGGPIVRMKEVAIQIADGKTDVPVSVTAGGEIGDLANAFRTMQENLRLISTQAQMTARGDLSQSVQAKGDLADAFNQMIGNLSELVRQVRDAGMRIDTFSAQMSPAIQEQTSTAAQQSAAISETTTTMEELARTSQEITDSADMVVKTAAQTQEDAQSGVETVKNTSAYMGVIKEANETSIQGIMSLSEKAQQINEVMDVINDIADRTKLIAFNAAIEAAGAGEMGKRFGVVAQEIRRLADTVVEATDDIRNRIVEIQEATNRMVIASENNTKSIEQGLEFMQNTASSLEKILESASGTTGAARQISLSTQQQRTASDQVVQSLQEVSEGAKQFANTVEATNNAASDLSELSGELTALIGRFKVDGAAESSSQDVKSDSTE